LDKAVYEQFAKRLIARGVVNQKEVDVIARKGTRKEYLWRRHVLDLAEYAIKKGKGMEELCNLMIQWCKQKR